MNQGEMLTITVPGSTANLGPGFDSVGMAINRYLTLDVKQSEEWVFIPHSEELMDIPRGKENLVYQVANEVAKQHGKTLPPCEVAVSSDIPMSRGLGSSASAIIAGIELANQLLDLDLSFEERLRIASLKEGHPDNVAASLYGGLIIGSHREDETDFVHGGAPLIDIVVYIPSYHLKTEKARSVLPTSMEYKEAVKASSISNVLVASLLTGNWGLAGKMMRKDLFHQPYRGELVPELKDVLSLADELGAYGAALSGAGPTMICFLPSGKGEDIQKQFSSAFPDARIESLKVDDRGVHVTRTSAEKAKQPF